MLAYLCERLYRVKMILISPKLTNIQREISTSRIANQYFILEIQIVISKYKYQISQLPIDDDAKSKGKRIRSRKIKN
jgi:hypothetical protein